METTAKKWPFGGGYVIFPSALTALAFLLLLGVGLFMRVYRIGAETMGPDEVFTMTYLYQDSVASAFQKARLLDPNMTPVYFCIQYAWSCMVGVSMFKCRVLSVILGMLCLPLLFVLGRRLANTSVALGATLLLGIHPIHVFYSMEIRNYALLALLGLASMYVFVRVLQGGGRWWWLALFTIDANLALTHLFASLLFVAQGLFLLFCFRDRVGWCFAWLAGHAVVAGLVLMWLLTAHLDAMRSANSYMQPPVLKNVLDMFCALGGGPYSRVLMLPSWLSSSPVSFGAPFAGVLLLSAGGLLLRLLFGRTASAVATDAESWDDRKSMVLLLLWLFVPLVLLLLVSFAYTPCFWARYVIYSAMAVPLVVSLYAIKLRPLALRLLAIALLVVLWKLEINVDFKARPQRDYWIPLCSYLETNIQANDTVMILPAYYSGLITGLEILGPFNGRPVLNRAAWTDAECGELRQAYEAGSGLWLIGRCESSPPQQQTEQCLNVMGAVPSVKDFRNVDLRVYHVSGTKR